MRSTTPRSRLRTKTPGRLARGRPVAVLAVGVSSLLLSTALAGTAAGAAPEGSVTVVAKGLNNPRHLVADARGDLYVAEAGRGAAEPKKAPCIRTVNPETNQPTTVCYGPTSAITRVRDGKSRRVVTGLPSVAEVTGQNATGVSDLTVPEGGTAVAVMNLGADPRKRSSALPGPARPASGHLLAVDVRNDRFRIGPDVAAFEVARNPDAADPNSGVDSNPYAVASGKSRWPVVVADAGGNDLLAVDRDGRIRLLAVFRARLVDAPAMLKLPPGTKLPMQSVPNSVTQGPDGAWYVGELTGFPFQPGAARVWRVVPGHAPTVVATGFTTIIDLAFDRHGHLLVLEIARNGLLDPTSSGALWRIGHDGSRTLVTSALTAPGGVVVAKDGHAYVTNRSTSAGTGEVLRVRLSR